MTVILALKLPTIIVGLKTLKTQQFKIGLRHKQIFSNTLIDKISGRDILLKRLKEYQQMGGDIFGKIVQCGNTYYYTKTAKGENLSKLYTRTLPNGNETLLFDPETTGKNTQLIDFIVDANGKSIAMKLSSGGAEICQARILDIKPRNYYQIISDLSGVNFQFNLFQTPQKLFIPK